MGPVLGFVGLGSIGTPMCRQLLERAYEVIVYDADPEAIDRLGDTEAREAGSLVELANSADVVLLSLPNSDIVEQVILGDEGLAEGLPSGSVIIDTSSSRPSSTRYIAETLSEKAISLLDAPVSGGVIRAREGKLAVMVGGERGVFERYQKVLEAFGEQVIHVGDNGTGHLAKAINNLVSAATLATAAEAVLLGARGGLDPSKVVEVINAGSGRSNSTEVKFPRYILNRAFDDGFAIELMDKDVRIALDEAERLEFPTPLGTSIGETWRSAVDAGYGKKGHTEIYAFLEELAGEREAKGDE